MLMAVLDDLFGSTSINTDANSFTPLSFAPGADLSWMGMDLDNISGDDQEPFSDAGLSSLEEDSDEDLDDKSEIHPSLDTSNNCPNVSDHTSLHMGDPDSVDWDDNSNILHVEDDLPDVVQRLQKQLLAGYTLPNHPSVNDPRDYTLTKSEEISLRHYIAWVDSRGTVKAYNLHAEVLQKAANVEILTLYMVRKLAIKVLGLSSQLVDMCPKSCMAFAGDFKDLQSCIYSRDKCNKPCGEPRFDKRVYQELK